MTIHATLVPHHIVDDLLDADAVHKATMGLFSSADLPGQAGARRAGSNILWRLEPGGILVTSDLPATDLPESSTVTTFTPDHPAGQDVKFIATIDATVRVRGREHRTADITGWLERKLHGALTEVTVRNTSVLTVRRRGQNLEQVTVWGEGVVASPTRLAVCIREGIGRSKTFGCGMLLVGAGQ